jgi:MFS transporter, OFA family, oxalate/formate antiporter
MGAAGTYQFIWSSLSGAVGARIAASDTALGTVFTLYIIAQTLVQLPAGHIRDRFGPQKLLIASGILMFVGYAGTAVASSIFLIYLSYIVGGVGAGIAYTVAVNTSVKWFDERRGLATGIVTMAYGGISVLLIPLFREYIDTRFTATLLVLGGIVGILGILAGLVIRDPEDLTISTEREDSSVSNKNVDQNGLIEESSSVGWRTAARTWQFWLFYCVLVIVNGVGLMLIGQSVQLTIELGLSAAVATSVASVVALADGAGILIISSLSDTFGGERTAGVSLLLCSVSLAGAIAAANQHYPLLFLLLTGGAAFFRSPVFSIFPNLVGSYYGEARSSENYALIYTAKVPGGVFGGTVASVLVSLLGWSMSFYLGAGLIAVAGLLTCSLTPTTAISNEGTTTDP